MIKTIFFDLDDTLYPSTSGLWDAIGDRINLYILYMAERLGLPADDVRAIRDRYYRAFGSTLHGLMSEHAVDPDDYLAFVHDLRLEDYIRPDPVLAEMLRRLPQTKVVLTNADLAHALRVLARLGVQDSFDAVIDIRALEWVNKPEPGAFRRAMQLAGASDPAECLLLEDSIRNLRAARELGMLTAYVGDRFPDGSADYWLRDVRDLVREVPGLLGPAGK